MGRRHHFVPQFYLDAFVDPSSRGHSNPYLWVVDLQNRTVERRSAKNVARITGFYEWKELGDRAPSIESIYSQIESRTALVMRKLWNGDFILTDKERYHLSIFLGLQFTRTPRFRNASNDASIKYALDWINSLVNDDKRLQASVDSYNMKEGSANAVLTTESIKNFITNGRFKITPHADYTLQMVLRAGIEFSKLIFTMHWLFVLSTEKACFFTCDVPVALLTPDAKPRKVDLEGAHNPELEMSFPISPSCMLLLQDHGFPEALASAGDDVVNEINRRIFPVIDRYVFCSSGHQGRWAIEQRICKDT